MTKPQAGDRHETEVRRLVSPLDVEVEGPQWFKDAVDEAITDRVWKLRVREVSDDLWKAFVYGFAIAGALHGASGASLLTQAIVGVFMLVCLNYVLLHSLRGIITLFTGHVWKGKL
jgi:hypothetical protein